MTHDEVIKKLRDTADGIAAELDKGEDGPYFGDVARAYYQGKVQALRYSAELIAMKLAPKLAEKEHSS